MTLPSKISFLFLLLPLAALGCTEEATPTQKQKTPDDKKGGKGDVIGEDDRREEFADDVSDELKEIARSTAMVMDNAVIQASENPDRVILSTTPLEETYGMCPGERLGKQPVTGMCSAWLVAPDIMVTNGHCITSQSDCESKSFVFDFTYTEENQDLSNLPKENVVACERMLAWDHTQPCEVDFAVVKLASPVTGRPPVGVRSPGEDLKEENLVIIGHPFGLPRKYALKGEVLSKVDNGFSTTHDIFGGNSGSAIFDAATGQVQAIATCGGSNLIWEEWKGNEKDWSLSAKTGKPCESSCDNEGLVPQGAQEPATVCESGTTRRRCVCQDNQLVWESRQCLPREGETQGACSRERQVSEFTCRTSPWLCAAPFMQSTHHFAAFVDAWSHHKNEESFTTVSGETKTSVITLEDPGVLQAASLFLDWDLDLTTTTAEQVAADLEVKLTHTSSSGKETVYDLIVDDRILDGTSNGAEASETSALDIPLLLPPSVQNSEAAGTWELAVRAKGFTDYTLSSWHLHTIVKPDTDGVTAKIEPCLGESCTSPFANEAQPIEDSFDGEKKEIDEQNVTGTLDVNWDVEVLDSKGTGYEVIKTKSSQILSMNKGEMAISREFGQDIGARALSVEFRYEGTGWFQIWADDQIIFSQNEGTQQTLSVNLPGNARRLKFLLGAVDDSVPHELTLFAMGLSTPVQQSEQFCQNGGNLPLNDDAQSVVCLLSGCESAQDCPNIGAAVCEFNDSTSSNLCLTTCITNADCAEGQECLTFNGSQFCGWRS